MSQLFDWEGPLPEESHESYHARDEYSASGIALIANCPWDFYQGVICKKQKATRSLSLGTIAHKAILEDQFDHLVAIPSKWETMAEQKKRSVENPRSVEDQKKDFIEHHNGFAVTQAEYIKIEGMYEAFRADPLARTLMSKDNIIEQGFRFYDEEHDLPCRFRADSHRVLENEIQVIDYKSAQSGAWNNFKWAIIRYKYHMKAAHYKRGFERLFPGKKVRFYFVAQDSSPFHAIGCYELTETDLMFGDNLRSQYIKKIKKYKARGEWPGYTEEIEKNELPDAGYDMEDFTDEA